MTLACDFKPRLSLFLYNIRGWSKSYLHCSASDGKQSCCTEKKQKQTTQHNKLQFPPLNFLSFSKCNTKGKVVSCLLPFSKQSEESDRSYKLAEDQLYAQGS